MNRKDSTQLQPDAGAQVNLERENGLTRRQFLTYVLGGTGAFMGTVFTAPLVVSAFDPLHRGASSAYSKTDWKVSDFNDKLPTHVKFMQHIDDAWNSQEKANDVFVIKYQNKLMIMSHVCTHLGCHVNGSEDGGKSVAPKYNNGADWFNCPCHGSNYNIYGVPTKESPAPDPLTVYDYQVVDGIVHVGAEHKRKTASWNTIPGQTI
jgi:menaquinol-cytochrome c reductase iron-sulfur subunit